MQLVQIVLIGVLSEEAQVGGKLGFTTGLAVGLLAGSRAGRGLYDKSAATATAVVNDPRVRQGATTALHKAGDAGSSVAGAAARKIKQRKQDKEASAEAGGEENGDAGDGAHAGRLNGWHWRHTSHGEDASTGHHAHGWQRHGPGARGLGGHARDQGAGGGFRALREGIAGITHHHGDHGSATASGNGRHPAASAPSAQPRPMTRPDQSESG